MTRRKRFAATAAAFALAVTVGVAAVLGFSQVANAATGPKVDPDTTNSWSTLAASSTSTKNIGRIWTDKSVFDTDYTPSGSGQVSTVEKDDASDFLVVLSALASTSNTTTSVTVGTPVDVVLVLDDSGSMTYGDLGGGKTRRQALQEAADRFIGAADTVNQGVPQENQIRMSIVTYSDLDATGVVCDWKYVTGEGTQSLYDAIDGLKAYGATRTDEGLSKAEGQLTNARQNAEKVVILFTDGSPTGPGTYDGNTFNCVTGAAAVNTAKSMKDGGATIYTIGIMDDADPSADDRPNNFLNAVSSNFPAATATGDNGFAGGPGSSFDVTWGEGSRDNGYYKTAENSAELNQVFDDIFDKLPISEGSGSPIEEEGALNPGTLTFTDPLGSYMEVTGGTMTVVYGNQTFTSKEVTTADNVDTYHFEGTVSGNAVYKEADLSELTVTVTHSDNLDEGDVVTAQIPASLIPMRNYNVDADAKTLTVTDAYPIRLFYNVSVKADAKTAINQGSGDTYDAIVESNKTDDGKVAFYSNLYRNGDGDTTASFTPSDGNKFYYYTSDTALYVDQNCTQHATTQNINRYNTLYYSEPYWEITSGNTAQEVTRGIAINRDGQDWSKMTTDRQGNYYIPAGTQRLDRPASLNTTKTNNETGTAETVLTPNWEGTGVVQRLGNNGKITYDLPGKLEIKKSVDWGNASDETKQNQNSFEFTVNFNGDETLEGNFSYDVYETGEDPVSDGTVADDGTITLKAGQRAVIKGLPADTTFTVTENEANKNGFTTTDTVTADPNNDTTDGIASGTIVGGSQQSVSFQNNYRADEPVQLSTETGLKVQKNLTGRDWRASDEFSFQITQIDNGAPTVQMANPTTVTVNQQTDQKVASFGDITFSESGQYRFRVEELSDADQGITPIVGIDYSGAIYRVTVDVADAGQGKLEIASVLIEQMINDDGGQGSGTVRGDTMAFENRYVSDQASETLQGTKFYTDTTGGNPIDAGKFSFQLEALGGYVTGTVTDEAQPDDYTIAANSDAMPKPAGMTGTTLETGNVGDVFQFPTIYFDGNDVGKTFEYRITELPQQYQGDAEQGMTYDTNTSYVVKIVVTEQQDPESEDPKVVIVAEPSLQPSDIKFTNKYEPTAAELTGTDAIHGTKKLDGREMKEGETFYFQLTATNDNAETVLASPETVKVTDQNAMDFAFADMTFTKVGTYTFQVNEVANEQGTETINGDGMTFDTNICTVTVDVTLNKTTGELEATVSYSNEKHADATDHAQFTNKYESTFDQGTAVTLNGTKYVDVAEGFTYDNGLANGKFYFPFTALDNAPSIGDGQWNKPGFAVPETNDFQATFSIFDRLTFSMADMDGQTSKDFVYIVTEKPGTDENSGAAMTYDSTAYRVTITVTDDLAGSLTAGTPRIEKGSWDGQTFTANADQTGVDQVLFVNSYAPKSLDGAANLNVTKIIDDRKFQDGDSFTFTLTGGDDATKKAITDGAVILPKNADGIETAYAEGDDTNTKSAAFGNIAFKAAGDYVFAVTETVPAGATNPNVDNGATTYENATPDQQAQGGWTLEGVTYGNQPHLVKVAVTVDSGGALVVAPDASTISPTITNKYDTSGDTTLDTKTKFGLTKELTGTDWDTESFTFEVSGEDEQGGSAPTPANVTDGTYTVDAAAATNGKAELDFGTITFDKTGTYTYTIKEKVPADTQGITYDTHEVTVKVSVTDNLHGGIEANVTEVTGEKAFVNEYSTELVYQNEGGLDIVKNLTGHDMAAGQFGFTVKPVDTQGGATAQEAADIAGIPVAGKTFSVTADDMVGDGVATSEIAVFDANGFHFTQAHDGMSYTYTVEETTKGGAGYTNDTSVYTVVISVEDDDAGTLTVTTAVTDSDTGTTTEYVYDNTDAQNDTAVVTFENSYSANGSTPATGDAALTATKTLHNADLADYTFTFNVTNNNGDVVTRGTSDASGVVTFTPISYTTTSLMADAQKGYCTYDADDDTFTYEYTVAEVNLPQGMTQNSTAQTVTVTVKDNGDGTLDARVSYPNGPLAFENTYGATSEATVNVAGSKTLVATDTAAGWKLPNIEGKFTFTVTGDSPLPVRADGAVATNVGGQIDLGTITYTMADMTDAVDNADGTRTKTFTYTVTEAGTVDGVTNAAPQTFTVEVTDDTQGGLTAVASTLDTGMQVAFENTYTVTPQDESVTGDGTGAITLTKQLTGDRTTVAAGEFNFEMVDQSGAQVSTGTTAADGSVEMSPITFTKAGDLTYTLREIDEGHGGVDYDTASYQVVAHVSDANADGTLQVTWEVKAAADGQALTNVTFTNTYTAADTSVVLGGSKVLDGRALAEGEFSFQLTDAEGNVLGTVKNDAKGGFAFDAITYGEPGTYEYTISEVKGDAEGVTYDDSTYAVKVVVTDDGQGKLQAEVTYNGKKAVPVFTNTYTEPVEPIEPEKPEKPETVIPKTSDTTNTVLLLVLAVGGVALVAGSLTVAKRRSK